MQTRLRLPRGRFLAWERVMQKLALIAIAAGAAALAPQAASAQVVIHPGGYGNGFGNGFGGGNFGGGFGGFAFGGFFSQPQYHVQNWQLYGFINPGADRRWIRYYDDAFLIDRRGHVFDSRRGVPWDRYGERWERDGRGLPYYAGRGDHRRVHGGERVVVRVRRQGDGYAGGYDGRGFDRDDDRYDGGYDAAYDDGYDGGYDGGYDDEDGRRYYDRDDDGYGACGGPRVCGGPGPGHGGGAYDGGGYSSGGYSSGGYAGGGGYVPAPPPPGACGPYACGGAYGQSGGYSSSGTVVITETTVTPMVTTVTEEVVEEVIEERAARGQVRHRRAPVRHHRAAPPSHPHPVVPSGERG